MGCCNKTHVGQPIGRLRYYGGLALLGGVQMGMYLTLRAAAVPLPRYRKVVPFYREYVRDTLDSVRRRERICVATGDPDVVCDARGDG